MPFLAQGFKGETGLIEAFGLVLFPANTSLICFFYKLFLQCYIMFLTVLNKNTAYDEESVSVICKLWEHSNLLSPVNNILECWHS